MNFRFIYSSEPQRLIAAVIMDSKSDIPEIRGKGGFETKAYVDSVLNLVQQNSGIVYKIVTFNENMVGYFALSVTNMGLSVAKIAETIRPNFKGVTSEITIAINTFLNNGSWRADYLQ